MFPYKVECLNEQEYMYLKLPLQSKKNVVNALEQTELLKIHNRVFNTNKKDQAVKVHASKI